MWNKLSGCICCLPDTHSHCSLLAASPYIHLLFLRPDGKMNLALVAVRSLLLLRSGIVCVTAGVWQWSEAGAQQERQGRQEPTFLANPRDTLFHCSSTPIPWAGPFRWTFLAVEERVAGPVVLWSDVLHAGKRLHSGPHSAEHQALILTAVFVL